MQGFFVLWLHLEQLDLGSVIERIKRKTFGKGISGNLFFRLCHFNIK